MSIPEISSIDLVAYSNYESPGVAWARGIDIIGDTWPDVFSSPRDIDLATYLAGDFLEDGVLTGEGGSMSWIAHPILLPFALNIPPWSVERLAPPWWIHMNFSSVLNTMRLEVYRHGNPRRILRIHPGGLVEQAGEPFPWEVEVWRGVELCPVDGLPADRVPSDTASMQVDLSQVLAIEGTLAAQDEGRIVGRCAVREGHVFWRALHPDPRATRLANGLRGSFVDAEGVALIDLDCAGSVATTFAMPATDSARLDESPDVEELVSRSFSNLLGVRSREDLRRRDWVGLEVAPTPNWGLSLG